MGNQIQYFDGEHPRASRFLSFVDGELAPKETAVWESHLDACWSCRVRVGRIQETIADIIGFDEVVAQFQAERPGERWSNFDSRLKTIVRETRPEPAPRGILKFIDQFWSFTQIGKFATAGVAAMLIFALLYQFVLVPPVSANDLLDKASHARSEQLRSASKPVVYQKLKVAEQDKTAVFEVWSDVESSRNKKAGDVSTGVLTEYEAIALKNDLDPQNPLSPEGFRVWRNRFAEKDESVSRINLPNGDDAFELRTALKQPREPGDIVEADLTVRRGDWHPVSQTIRARGQEDTKVFVISELEFRVISRNTLADNFFDDATKSAPRAAAIGGPTASPEIEPPADCSDSRVQAAPAATANGTSVATPDLEVEVMRLLNQAGADIDDQTDVTRTADGKLQITGLVDTIEKKNRIMQALTPVKGNPALVIRIETYTEAAARQKQTSSAPSVVERIEVNKGRIAVYDDVRRYLGKGEADADEGVRRFSAQVLNSSRQVMSIAGTLKKVAGRFSKDDLKSMSPDARGKWLAVVRTHARTCEEETKKLRQQLAAVFGGSGDAAAITIGSDGDIAQAAARLFNEASASDRIIRSAFTILNDPGQASAIKSPQFSRSLANAERLAAALQGVK